MSHVTAPGGFVVTSKGSRQAEVRWTSASQPDYYLIEYKPTFNNQASTKVCHNFHCFMHALFQTRRKLQNRDILCFLCIKSLSRTLKIKAMTSKIPKIQKQILNFLLIN